MYSRRRFVKQLSGAGLLGAIPTTFSPAGPLETYPKSITQDKIWACFIHLSFNFALGIEKFGGLREELELDEPLWNDALKKMKSDGLNMVVMNLDDSVAWESHPEIAVRNAWPVSRLREEIKKIRGMGLEPIPQFNFSTAHDAWLKKWARMVSTPAYYQVCSDLIKEVCEIFDTPRFFHIGMDEETAEHQIAQNFNHIVVRQKDLWWGDFYFLVGEVLKNGSRPWIWSDYIWHHPELFLKRMPKEVLQSNWYYGEAFGDQNQRAVKAYLDLEAHGYDQIPTGSYHRENEHSIMNTVRFCSEHIPDQRLFGFMQTIWNPTIEQNRTRIMKAIELTGNAKKWFSGNYREKR